MKKEFNVTGICDPRLHYMVDTDSRFTRECGKPVVLTIDEVDKSSDNQLFLSFLGMLRVKYLDIRNHEKGYLLCFDLSLHKEPVEPAWREVGGKRIFEVRI